MSIDIAKIKKDAIKIKDKDFSYINSNYLRQFRINMNLTQAALADYLGVTKKAIEKWEQGKNKINPAVARLIYIFEYNPQFLSLIKEISIDNKVIYFNKIDNFQVESIENSTQCSQQTNNMKTFPKLRQNNSWEFA